MLLNESGHVVAFIRKMLLITFPSGTVIWDLLSVQSSIMPELFPDNESCIAFRWVFISVGGYIQWFFIVPKLISTLHKKMPIVIKKINYSIMMNLLNYNLRIIALLINLLITPNILFSQKIEQ